MDNEKLSVEVHTEFAKRIEEHNAIQDKRLDALEKNVQEIQNLTVSIEKMTIGIESMTKEMGRQNESINKLDSRLDDIEKEPADKWKRFVWLILAAVVGGVLVVVGQTIGLPL